MLVFGVGKFLRGTEITCAFCDMLPKKVFVTVKILINHEWLKWIRVPLIRNKIHKKKHPETNPNSGLQWHFTSQLLFFCKKNACFRGFSKETGIAPHHHEVSHAIRAAHLPTLELWSTSAWPPILQMQVKEPSSLETEPFTVNCLTL